MSASKRLTAAGVAIERVGRKVIFTASDEFEAGLVEDSLKDPELVALIVLTGALRRLPSDKSRFHAVNLVNALLAAGSPLPEVEDGHHSTAENPA